MKKEEIEQKVNEVEKISACVLYENGTAKEVPNNYTFQAHIDIPKMVKNMELEEQEELIDWIIEKINERQRDRYSEPIVISDDGTVKINAATVTLTSDKSLKKD